MKIEKLRSWGSRLLLTSVLIFLPSCVVTQSELQLILDKQRLEMEALQRERDIELQTHQQRKDEENRRRIEQARLALAKTQQNLEQAKSDKEAAERARRVTQQKVQDQLAQERRLLKQKEEATQKQIQQKLAKERRLLEQKEQAAREQIQQKLATQQQQAEQERQEREEVSRLHDRLRADLKATRGFYDDAKFESAKAPDQANENENMILGEGLQDLIRLENIVESEVRQWLDNERPLMEIIDALNDAVTDAHILRITFEGALATLRDKPPAWPGFKPTERSRLGGAFLRFVDRFQSEFQDFIRREGF